MAVPAIERHRVRDDIEFYEWRGQKIMITLCQEVLEVEEVGDSLVMLSHDHLSDEYEVEISWIKDGILYNRPIICFRYRDAKALFDEETSTRNLSCQDGQFLLNLPIT